ncbi:MAG: hypothetical protein JSR98_15015, partial [Proteobacteria bacterium]|nr:hypothetical protein [Pseudomonadota bacterium]
MPMTVLGALAYLQGLVPALGWTLAHFLWQGALVAFALQVVLKACRTSRARHDWALAALMLMAILPLATFAWLQGGVRIVLVPSGFPGLTPAGRQWETFAVDAWLVGVAILAVRLAGGLVLVERLRRSAEPLPTTWILRCRLLEQRIVLQLKVAFAQSEAVATPIVAGWLKPMVLVPAGFLTRLPPAELEALILHELAHVRRLDAFANLIQSVVETLLFYHPAVWWVSRRIRLEREQCCDEVAANAIRDRALYVRALQSLETLRASPHGVLAANGEGELKRRAAHILGLAAAPERPALSRTAAVAVLALGAAAMTHSATVRAEPGRASDAVGSSVAIPRAEASSASAALRPLAGSSARRPALAPAPRIVLAAADVATPTPLVEPQPATSLAIPVPAPGPQQVKVAPVAYAPTVGPLVVSPIKPLKPDTRIDAGSLDAPAIA